ncbi:hypothetical protein HanRHA438_Chr08g0368721 [Helianthus annuus]|uniref:Transmembrane protein n=1 Tax=Helianthus annuus TaxID=4232 RepID=A0A251UA56_HELAN|nr:hypothetical protein HanXRQr2_Chr08g0356621 [Helianthus annuus]KAJ0540109.1 hypothetical protein HanHA300_Chr08g0294501 [Helianthus annuus]KAJ0548532.1 hypothetical protein HanIR_Chr08g0384871 [Helianthus annuus]KAJ0554853.1 hypothetical protein HanHA89_Chr08g0313021 [Helianthus annuus]KAJ0720416.1 hypothetical protein HanLR1_Chr08g0293321 [Helianthus annuus]
MSRKTVKLKVSHTIFFKTNHILKSGTDSTTTFLHSIMADEEDPKPDISKFAVIRSGLFRLFNFPLIGSTVLILLFYWRLRLRRRRVRNETIDGLLGVIKEKDERITHLLHQIARMNELLLATRHGVPITSKAASG